MALVTHRRYPHIFFSTSRDRSIRIHDLHLACDVKFANPRVPLPTGSLVEGLYGPTFGMPLTEEEGSSGFGKCIGVFTGGEVSHGHKAAVLNAVWVLQAPDHLFLNRPRTCIQSMICLRRVE